MNPKKFIALVNALENYCKAAENNFGVRTYDNLDIAQADFTAYKPVKTGSETAKLALVTNSETAIRIAYEGTGAVTYGGKTLTKTDGYYFIRNIPAHQLGIGKTLKIGDTTFENMSALSYGYYVMKDSSNENLKTLVNALYAYAKAAEAYKAAQ